MAWSWMCLSRLSFRLTKIDRVSGRARSSSAGVGNVGAALRYQVWYERGSRPGLVADIGGNHVPVVTLSAERAITISAKESPTKPASMGPRIACLTRQRTRRSDLLLHPAQSSFATDWPNEWFLLREAFFYGCLLCPVYCGRCLHLLACPGVSRIVLRSSLRR